MKNYRMSFSLLVIVYFFFGIAVFANKQETNATTTIRLNKERVNVFFNDGDTFKVLDGSFKNSRVRIIGINTLETYGPVHQWSKNSPKYLLDIANLAARLAKKGGWNCQTYQEKDMYDRLLARCDDFSLALLKEGYAHAYSIAEKPALISYLAMQKQAQQKKIGMWKYGVPNFIITSLHSSVENNKKTYNRLISAHDGHSKVWHHQDNYNVCQKVCIDDDSCMVYVPFEQRYKKKRPECLLLKQ
jgi:endonuclease YncB( thermonuclease family)